MAFSHGRQTRVLVDAFNLSSYFNELTTTRELELSETTTFSATAKTWLSGYSDGTASVSGYFDGSADAVDDVLSTALGAATSSVVTVCREALDAVGDRAEVFAALETTYEVASSIDDAVSVSAEFQADGGIDAGVVLHALEAETADANEASVDNAAGTTNGGVAHLHVTAYSGLDTVTVYVEHSTDDSSWSTLVTFTAFTDVTAERVVVAASTTVNRYLRVRTDATGTGSTTFAVAFARR